MLIASTTTPEFQTKDLAKNPGTKMVLTWAKNLDNNQRTKMTISKNSKTYFSSVQSLFPKLLQFMILKENLTSITTQVPYLNNKCSNNNNYTSSSSNNSNSQASVSSQTLLSSNSCLILASNSNSLSSLNSNSSSHNSLNSNNNSPNSLNSSSKQISVSSKKPSNMWNQTNSTHSKDSRWKQRRPKTTSHSTKLR